MVNCTAGHIAIKQNFDELALKEDVKPPRVHDERDVPYSFFLHVSKPSLFVKALLFQAFLA
jgi:hypothetical protein